MKDLKDYREQPDKGLFEKIQRRLAVRRAMRIGGTVLAGVAVAVVAFSVVSVLALQDRRDVGQQQMAAGESGKAVVMAENTVAPTTEVVTDNVREQIVKTTVAMPLDSTPAVAVATLPEESFQFKFPVSVFSRRDSLKLKTENLNLPQTEALIPGEQPLAQAETIADNDGKTAAVPEENKEKQSTEDVKSSPQNPHYDNIIWAPNVIVRGGEVEENRVFSISASSEITNFSLQVFNRGGMRVYSTVDTDFKWDAAGMPQGAYVWVATFRDTDGHPRQEKGSVVVVR